MVFALLLFFGSQPAKPARAATMPRFTVNSTGDENDLDFPGGTFDGSSDGKCDVSLAPTNQCTLRAAIQAANKRRGADTIKFKISGNGPLGIDLSGGGREQDTKDPDTGANNKQNFPVITSAQTFASFTSINGTLNSTPSTRKIKRTFIIQFFSNPSTGSTDEGKTFLGQVEVTTNRQGNASFGFAPDQEVLAGRYITATATNKKTGDTSEFSQARVVEEPVIGP
jgi:CSLREA domain-containing protein